MKKIFLIFVVVLAFFPGCFGPGEILSMQINNSNGDSLLITPDYSMRTFSVTYFDVVSDSADEGIVGGEFFDRFEAVVEWMQDIDDMEELEEYDVQVTVITEKNQEDSNRYYFDFKNEIEGLGEFKSFHDDLTDLLFKDLY